MPENKAPFERNSGLLYFHSQLFTLHSQMNTRLSPERAPCRWCFCGEYGTIEATHHAERNDEAGDDGMYRIAIVEDSPRHSIKLKEYLDRYQAESGAVFQVETWSNGLSFLEGYRSDCDVILMDIEMPHLNGIETARRLRKLDGEVCLIFVTYMAKYALEGYEVQAMDFLLKPVEYPGFAMKLRRALQHRDRARSRGGALVINTADGLRRADIQDIYYVEVLNHTLIYHTGQGELTERGAIRDREEALEAHGFVRCSNSFLINMGYVEYLTQGTVVIKGRSIPISRARKKAFLERFTEYVGANI